MSNHALLVFGFVIGMVLTVAVGVDAHNRGRSGFIWGLLTFFTGIIGAFVYVLVLLTGDGPDDATADTVRRCSNCSSTHPGTPDYCSDCGHPLQPDDDTPVATILRSGSHGYCSNCKAKVELDADSCSECGAVL